RAHAKELMESVARFLPSARNKKLLDTAVEFAGRSLIANYFSPASSGIVIAGFGNAELFPAMVHLVTDGYIGTQIKLSKPQIVSITKDNPSVVSGFAQHDIVHRFMEGIDPEYSSYLQGLIQRTIVKTNLAVFEKWAPKKLKNDKGRRAVERAARRQ